MLNSGLGSFKFSAVSNDYRYSIPMFLRITSAREAQKRREIRESSPWGSKAQQQARWGYWREILTSFQFLCVLLLHFRSDSVQEVNVVLRMELCKFYRICFVRSLLIGPTRCQSPGIVLVPLVHFIIRKHFDIDWTRQHMILNLQHESNLDSETIF